MNNSETPGREIDIPTYEFEEGEERRLEKREEGCEGKT
jgi:hypothetical protein